MTKHEENSNQKAEGVDQDVSRRNLLLGSGALLVGGIAGRMSKAEAASDPAAAKAPPLPWKWPAGIDPMEAGTRTYQTYLKQKG